MWLLCKPLTFACWSIMNIWKAYGLSQAKQLRTNAMPDFEAPLGLHTHKEQYSASSPLGDSPGCSGESACWSGLIPSVEVIASEAWERNEWHSPAAPGGNQRPDACGSASGRKGRPRRGWCIYPVLALTLRVWPGGLPAPLGTRGGEPFETTGGSIAGDYKEGKKWLGSCSWCDSQGKTNSDIKRMPIAFSHQFSHLLTFWEITL